MIKKIFIAYGLLFLLQIYSALGQQEIIFDPELKITKLTDKIWVITHCFPWDSNSLIIRAGGNEVVMIDTPYTNEATETILQYIKKEINPDRITAILTGFHIDNLGGTGCLLRHQIPVYGSDKTCKLVDERSGKTQQQVISWLKSPEQDKYRAIYAGMTFRKPDHVFPISEGLQLKKGALSFEVFVTGESHSPDNLTVYVKELNLLFGGCMVKSLESNDLGFTGDANLTEWPKSVKKIQLKYKEAKRVIPHHGKWGDITLLQHTLDLLNK